MNRHGLFTEHVRAIDLRLPVELWSMIHEMNVAEWEEEIWAWPFSNAVWPQLWAYIHTVSVVSRGWRATAIKTPRLWANLWLGNFNADLQLQQERHDSMAKYDGRLRYCSYTVCLESSAAWSSVPLSIHADTIPQFRAMMEAVKAAGAECRVRRIRIGSDNNYVPDELGELPLPICPFLNELSVHLGSVQDHAETLITLLQTYWNVKLLSITRTRTDGMQQRPAIVLPNLTHLRMLQSDGWEITNAFSIFSAPSLKCLEIIREDTGWEQDAESLIIRSHGVWNGLESLTYNGIALCEDILGVLHQAPNLQELVLSHLTPDIEGAAEDYDSLFDGLVSAHGGGMPNTGGYAGQNMSWPVPRLREICLDDVPVSYDAILRLVKKRNRSGFPLEELSLTKKYFKDFGKGGIKELKKYTSVVW